MKNLLTACVIVLGVIFVYGFVRGDGTGRMRLTKIDEKRGITLVVSMPDVDARYEVLHVEGCSAEVTEAGVFCLPDGWATKSTRSISRASEPIPMPDCPRGTVHFWAFAVDQNVTVLAKGDLVLLR